MLIKDKKCFFIIITFFLFFLLIGCSSSYIDKSNPENLLKSVFGQPQNNNDNGMVDFQISGQEAIIHYHYFPVGITSYEEEVGFELSPKLKTLFETSNTFDEIIIVAYGPFSDVYGNITWKPMLSMEITREIINKINWDNFDERNLTKIAKNVKVFRK